MTADETDGQQDEQRDEIAFPRNRERADWIEKEEIETDERDERGRDGDGPAGYRGIHQHDQQQEQRGGRLVHPVIIRPPCERLSLWISYPYGLLTVPGSIKNVRPNSRRPWRDAGEPP